MSEPRSEAHGYYVVPMLECIWSLPWNAYTQALVDALRPSAVRVSDNGEIKTDVNTWRVTVFLSPDRTIKSIEQEVRVPLPEGCEHGYALACRLHALGAKLL